jgi:hypothetical protein
MATFIKLSCAADKPIWISVAHIAYVGNCAKTAFPMWKASVGFGNGDGATTSPSPKPPSKSSPSSKQRRSPEP